MGQIAPSAAILGEVKQGIDDLASLVLGMSSASFGGRNQGFEQLPLVIGQIS